MLFSSRVKYTVAIVVVVVASISKAEAARRQCGFRKESRQIRSGCCRCYRIVHSTCCDFNFRSEILSIDKTSVVKSQEPPPVTSIPREVTANDPTRGKKSRQAGGYLGAVGHARFYAEHKMIFISVEHALNLFWAERGKYPKTHDEFMESIIRLNQIQLPELDPGVEYIYDPVDHKLKIFRPDSEEN